MAIDFMIMPMSRYISGDFVTPNMRFSWERGIPYTVIGPEGTRECPPGEPFGGADAPKRRAAMQEMLREDLEKLPPAITRWDEHSHVEPRFHRVDPTSYQALLEQAKNERAEASFLLFFKPKRPTTLHVTATLFLPCAFDDVFEMSSPFERVTGSVKKALDELSSRSWGSEAQSARDVLVDALKDAAELRLPMIVDW